MEQTRRKSVGASNKPSNRTIELQRNTKYHNYLSNNEIVNTVFRNQKRLTANLYENTSFC